MVTTVKAGIAPVAGAPTADQRAESGGDGSVFAQLIGGTSTDASASESSPVVVPASAGPIGKPVSGKSAQVRMLTDVDQSAPTPADMLALCVMSVPSANPVTAKPESTVSDAPASAAETSAPASSAGIDPSAMMVSLQIPGSVESRASATRTENASDGSETRLASRAVDLQRSGNAVPVDSSQLAAATSTGDTTGAVIGDAIQPDPQETLSAAQQTGRQVVQQSVEPPAKPSTQNSAAQPEQHRMSAKSGAIQVPVLPESQATDPAQQPVVEKLLAQVTPMMGMMTAQLREAGLDRSVREATSGNAPDSVAAVTASALQPAGTQLAGDLPATDVASRHQLHASVGSHQWATELGNKLTMLATRDTQSATLYMTPADLGPVQVRIDLHQDQASVWFTAEHAETRSALEQSLPRLREMFTAQGMALTDAGVFGGQSHRSQTESGFTSARFVSSQYEDSESLADTATVRSISLGLLDAYA